MRSSFDLFAVASDTSNSLHRQCKCATQRQYGQCKGYKDQYHFAYRFAHLL